MIRHLKELIFKIPFIGKLFSILRRVKIAKKYYRKKNQQINTWILKNTELSNFYYHLTEQNTSYLISLLATLTKSDNTLVKKYVEEITNNDSLRNHIRFFYSGDKRMKDSSFGFGRRIGWYALIRTLKPKIIVETGVDQGLGACVIAEAIKANILEGFEGQYFGTEINTNAGGLFNARYKIYGEIIYGDSIETLKNFNKKIDLFINDSDHSSDYEYREYETITNLISQNGWILGDNSHACDSLWRFSNEQKRNFVFFQEEPLDHWYPGAGIGISFPK